ncbi:MAG: anthranilate synthase component I [Deltaproteobacteria bacterium RIFOXYA12_FULL_58_15]|nr:MAG: anthranilate synthase component I [Deltaproteobacteria bacterium RIFOXYA12_FULL_58_15]OGR12812.1 MAG: anthranilate synthase component I [Deltaproteobacteria bacterium RIFOXYB12_FULL_58_9]
MNPADLVPGEVLPLTRRLSGCPDPIALFDAVCDGGRKPNTVLLESAEIGERGEQSILVVQSAVRLECRGNEVVFRSLSPAGHDVLPWLASRLDGMAETSTASESLLARFPGVPTHTNVDDRITAPSAVDAIRTLATGWHFASRPATTSLLVAGAFAYDLLEQFETLPPAKTDPLDFPDFVFWLPQVTIILNHKQKNTLILSNVFGGAHAQTSYSDAAVAIEQLATVCTDIAAQPTVTLPELSRSEGTAQVDMSDVEYAQAVRSLKERVVAGDVFQIVPSRTFSAPCADPLAAYARLRAQNPSPYMFYLKDSGFTLFGASPETCVRVTGRPQQVEITPIAGTRGRGKKKDGSIDLDLDGRLEAELRLDKKELAEHMMLVDLARNDVARVCVPGSRHVPNLLSIARYSEVMHLVSRVVGELRPGFDALHAYIASMNMGTLVGAPKIKAAQILRETERGKRGPYGGAVGYITADGDMDTAIVIRSTLVKDDIAYVRAGAGVVYDSEPMSEAIETRRKARAVLSALGHNLEVSP